MLPTMMNVVDKFPEYKTPYPSHLTSAEGLVETGVEDLFGYLLSSVHPLLQETHMQNSHPSHQSSPDRGKRTGRAWPFDP